MQLPEIQVTVSDPTAVDDSGGHACGLIWKAILRGQVYVLHTFCSDDFTEKNSSHPIEPEESVQCVLSYHVFSAC